MNDRNAKSTSEPKMTWKTQDISVAGATPHLRFSHLQCHAVPRRLMYTHRKANNTRKWVSGTLHHTVCISTVHLRRQHFRTVVFCSSKQHDVRSPKNKQNPSLGSWLFRTSAFEQQLRKAKFCHLRFLAVLSRLMHAHRKANWIRAWVSCSLQHACCMHSCSPVAESLWRGGTWEWKTKDIIETYLVEFLCAYWTSLITRSLARNFDRRPTVHDCAIDESGVFILCYGKWKRGNLG